VFRSVPHPGQAVPDRKSTRKPGLRNRAQALLEVNALVEALAEADAFDPLRPTNRPPPALWLDNPDYLKEARTLLAELREFREVLRDGDKPGTGRTAGKRGVVLLASATVKFIDGYADALGKGAAALTIGAAGALLFQIGASKDILESLWDHLRSGR